MQNPVIKNLILLLPLVLPLGLALDMYIPSVPSMTKALDATPTEIQLTLSIFLYAYGFGQLLFGPLSDSFGRRKILLTSALLFIAGSAICFMVQTVHELIGGRVLQAFGACGMHVVALAMVRDQFSGQKATFIYSFLKAASSLAPILGPIVGAFLQISYGWRAAFVALSIYGLAMFLLASIAMSETLKKVEPFNLKTLYVPAFKKALQKNSFLYYCFCTIAAQASMFGYFSLSSHFFIGLHGLSEKQFAHLFSINACMFLITGAIMGKSIYKIGIRKCTLIGGFLFLISGISMVMSHHFYHSHYVLFIPNLIASSGAAIMLGAATSGALLPFKTHIGMIAALLGCLEFIGGGLLGSLGLMGSTLSVQPLGILLVVLGFSIMLLNQFLGNTIEQTVVTSHSS